MSAGPPVASGLRPGTTTTAPIIASGSAWADPRRPRHAASSPGTDRENPPSFLPPESSIIIKTHFLTHHYEAMAKKSKAEVKAAATQPSLITTRKTSDKALRQAVRAIPGFPDLKVHQWMPTLMSQCRLHDKPKKNERVYRVAYDCCKNARVRR